MTKARLLWVNGLRVARPSQMARLPPEPTFLDDEGAEDVIEKVGHASEQAGTQLARIPCAGLGDDSKETCSSTAPHNG